MPVNVPKKEWDRPSGALGQVHWDRPKRCTGVRDCARLTISKTEEAHASHRTGFYLKIIGATIILAKDDGCKKLCEGGTPKTI